VRGRQRRRTHGRLSIPRVDADLKGHFDTIPKDRLMLLLMEKIADTSILKLIQDLPDQNILVGCVREKTPYGSGGEELRQARLTGPCQRHGLWPNRTLWNNQVCSTSPLCFALVDNVGRQTTVKSAGVERGRRRAGRVGMCWCGGIAAVAGRGLAGWGFAGTGRA
jgi:hypothetical protein